MWTPQLNAVLGSLAVTIGFWLTWGEMPLALAVVVALCTAAFLTWQGSRIAIVWAWATLLLGVESLAWPIVTMVQIRLTVAEPTDEQMGRILTAVLFGLFSSIFWLTFAYGIFKWVWRKEAEAAASASNKELRRQVGQKPR
ncbi:MAG: hypothetical protein ACREI2_04540 [Nitrospiraceae bacterium]